MSPRQTRREETRQDDQTKHYLLVRWGKGVVSENTKHLLTSQLFKLHTSAVIIGVINQVYIKLLVVQQPSRYFQSLFCKSLPAGFALYITTVTFQVYNVPRWPEVKFKGFCTTTTTMYNLSKKAVMSNEVKFSQRGTNNKKDINKLINYSKNTQNCFQFRSLSRK